MNDIKSNKIKKFFEGSFLDLKKFPDNEVSDIFSRKTKYSVYDLTEIESEKAVEEIKNILNYMLVTNKDLRQTSFDLKYRPLFYVVSYIRENNIDSIYDLNETIMEPYFVAAGIKTNRNFNQTIYDLQVVERSEREKDLGLYKSVISYKDCNLNSVRLNHSTPTRTMDFGVIENEMNRELLRTYIIYLIELTSISYDTIVSYFSIIRAFLFVIKDTNLTDLTYKIIADYIQESVLADHTDNHKNTIIAVLNSFLDYLYSKKLIKKTFYLSNFKVKANYKTIHNRVDEYAMEQIGECLDKLPNPYFLIYLVIYCTGMRVSEACELDTSCLYKFTKYDETFYAIRYKSEKMHDKSVMNLIPKELYDLMDSYIKKEHNIKSDYLFPSVKDKDKPFQTHHYSKTVKKFFREQGVINADGTPYNYKPHSYRHELASSLIDDDVPIYIVQDVCHHQSIEMTLAYAEISKKHKHKKHIEYITNHGELDLMLKEECVGKDSLILSNGLCANPFYDCHQINKCLECKHFRTDISHLKQFREYKKDLEEALSYYELNCFKPQIATTKKIIERVSVIINALEKLDEKEE